MELGSSSFLYLFSFSWFSGLILERARDERGGEGEGKGGAMVLMKGCDGHVENGEYTCSIMKCCMGNMSFE
jgi:hypothetical protein